MNKVVRIGGKSKRERVLGEVPVPDAESLGKIDMDKKMEVIQALISLGLMVFIGCLWAEMEEIM